MNCPKCGRPMKQYGHQAEIKGKHPHPDIQLWGCKMHYGKWGVWIRIEGLKAAGPAIPTTTVKSPLGANGL